MWTRRVELTYGAAIRNIRIHTHPLTARVVKQQYTEFGESNRPLAHAAMMVFDTALRKNAFLAGDLLLDGGYRVAEHAGFRAVYRRADTG